MDDTEQPDSSGSGHPALPSSATALATRTVLAALKSAGYEKQADWLAQAPEKLGGAVGRAIATITGKRRAGEEVTQRDEDELRSAIEQEPAAGLVALGSAIAAVAGSDLDAESERERNLECYRILLDLVCESMRAAKTSYALRGFILDAPCVSYWHLTGDDPKFLSLASGLQPFDFDIYLIFGEVSDDDLRELNATIRRDRRRHLPAPFLDFAHDEDIAKVEAIDELRIFVKRLHPNRNELQKKRLPFSVDDYTKPVRIEYDIPFGAGTLQPVLDSLFSAAAVQRQHTHLVDALSKTATQRTRR